MHQDTKEISREFFVDVYENSPDLYFLVELETAEILSCNDTAAEALGVDKEELVGSEIAEIYHPEDREAVAAVREGLRREGRVDNLEVRVVRADGESFWASLSATAVREDGEVVAARSSLRDISDLKETEQTLRRRTRRLERSNEELEQFAYLASHDLQEPLRMVASYTQLLAKRYEEELDERAAKYIGYAVEGAERMQELLNDLLEYSRLGGVEEPFGRVEMNELLEEVLQNLKLQVDAEGVEVSVGELPAVDGARSQLLHLMQNLVENALKFHDEPPRRVEIDGERDGEYCVIRVCDNGVGFDPDNAERVFQIFQRLHERGEYEGTGTGLAIAKKVVDNHHGEIDVESTDGEGTTFSVYLKPPESRHEPHEER